MPPGYYKHHAIAVLTGCVARHPNCRLARARHVIGMQVTSAGEQMLRPEYGMLTQIIEAFRGRRPVALEFAPRDRGGESVTVSFTGNR